jgi:hypothetical protein
MSKTEYYYQGADGSAHGRLPLDTIRLAVDTGRMAGDVCLARTAAGPWVPLPVVMRLGARAFGMNGDRIAKALAKDKRPARVPNTAKFFDKVGLLQIALALTGAAVAIAQGRFAELWVCFAVLANGFLCVAVGEVLTRLGQIAGHLEKLAARE